MIKFTMGSSDAKKTPRRKPKRMPKSCGVPPTQLKDATLVTVPPSRSNGVVNGCCHNTMFASSNAHLSNPSDLSLNYSEWRHEQDMSTSQLQINSNEQSDGMVINDLTSCNLSLNGENCFVCHQPRIDCQEMNNQEFEVRSLVGNYTSFSPLWVCFDCKQSIQMKEERQNNYNEDGLMFNPPSSPVPTNDVSSETTALNVDSCNCSSCAERRLIKEENDKFEAELQHYIYDLHRLVSYVYHPTRSGDRNGKADNGYVVYDGIDVARTQDFVKRLCSRDPHLLFQCLDSQAQEFIAERSLAILQHLPPAGQPLTIQMSSQFVASLLDEYTHLCQACKQLSGLFALLEEELLKSFKLTIELHHKFLFHRIVFAQLHKYLPNVLAQIRSHAAKQTKETVKGRGGGGGDSYSRLLDCYVKLEGELNAVLVDWQESCQLIDRYREEQAAVELKQKMLQDDWELFRTWAKFQKTMDSPKATNLHQVQRHGTETVSSKTESIESDVHCNCLTYKETGCLCDRCSLEHMVSCGGEGGISEEDGRMFLPNCHLVPFMNVPPPSVSSCAGGSSSPSGSLNDVDTNQTLLPFDESIEGMIDGRKLELDAKDEEDDDEEEEEEEEDRRDLCGSSQLKIMQYIQDQQQSAKEFNFLPTTRSQLETILDGLSGLEKRRRKDDDDCGGTYADEEEEESGDENDDDDDDNDNEARRDSCCLLLVAADDHRNVSGDRMISAADPSSSFVFEAEQSQQVKFSGDEPIFPCVSCSQQQIVGSDDLPLPSPFKTRSAFSVCPHSFESGALSGLPRRRRDDGRLNRRAGDGVDELIAGASELSLERTEKKTTKKKKKAFADLSLNDLDGGRLSSLSFVAAGSPFAVKTGKSPPCAINKRWFDLPSKLTVAANGFRTISALDGISRVQQQQQHRRYELGVDAAENVVPYSSPSVCDVVSDYRTPYFVQPTPICRPIDDPSLTVCGRDVASYARPNVPLPLPVVHHRQTTSGCSRKSPDGGTAGAASLQHPRPRNDGLGERPAPTAISPSDRDAGTAAAVALTECLAPPVTKSIAETGGALLAERPLLVPTVTSKDDGVEANGAWFMRPADRSCTTTTASSSKPLVNSLSQFCLDAKCRSNVPRASSSSSCPPPSASSVSVGHRTAMADNASAPRQSPSSVKAGRHPVTNGNVANARPASHGLSLSPPTLLAPPPSMSLAPPPALLASPSAASLAPSLALLAPPTASLAPALLASPSTASLAPPLALSAPPSASSAPPPRHAAASTVGNENLSGRCGKEEEEEEDEEEEEEEEEESYDSNEEESGSDESCCTSTTSNQKDSKYCECWHCEFFGHSAPVTLPTSKNYAEMRDRLRLRLKKKNEQKTTEPGMTPEDNDVDAFPIVAAAREDVVCTRNAAAAPPRDMDVEELLKFINGENKTKMESKMSAKAAKRARQKQRKEQERVKKLHPTKQQKKESGSVSVRDGRRRDRCDADDRRANETAIPKHDGDALLSISNDSCNGNHKNCSADPNGKKAGRGNAGKTDATNAALKSTCTRSGDRVAADRPLTNTSTVGKAESNSDDKRVGGERGDVGLLEGMKAVSNSDRDDRRPVVRRQPTTQTGKDIQPGPTTKGQNQSCSASSKGGKADECKDVQSRKVVGARVEEHSANAVGCGEASGGDDSRTREKEVIVSPDDSMKMLLASPLLQAELAKNKPLQKLFMQAVQQQQQQQQLAKTTTSLDKKKNGETDEATGQQQQQQLKQQQPQQQQRQQPQQQQQQFSLLVNGRNQLAASILKGTSEVKGSQQQQQSTRALGGKEVPQMNGELGGKQTSKLNGTSGGKQVQQMNGTLAGKQRQQQSDGVLGGKQMQQCNVVAGGKQMQQCNGASGGKQMQQCNVVAGGGKQGQQCNGAVGGKQMQPCNVVAGGGKQGQPSGTAGGKPSQQQPHSVAALSKSNGVPVAAVGATKPKSQENKTTENTKTSTGGKERPLESVDRASDVNGKKSNVVERVIAPPSDVSTGGREEQKKTGPKCKNNLFNHRNSESAFSAVGIQRADGGNGDRKIDERAEKYETSAACVTDGKSVLPVGRPIEDDVAASDSTMPVAAAAACGGKIKKKKGKGKKTVASVDDIFLPKEVPDDGQLDEFEREIEEFKRFCFNSAPAGNREKLQVNVNLKDIFSKKKSGIGY